MVPPERGADERGAVERQDGEDGTRYVRTYSGPTVQWRPPALLPHLLPTEPIDSVVAERIDWQRRVSDAASTLHDGVVAEQVLGWTDRTIAVAGVEGAPVRGLLAASRVRACPAEPEAAVLGAWMARLHAIERRSGQTSTEGFVAHCEHALTAAAMPAALAAVAKARTHDLGRPWVPDSGLSHGDTSTANLLWDGQRGLWGVIDFEHGYLRPAAHDLGVLLANVLIAACSPASSASRCAAFVGGLLQGYAAEGGEKRDTQLAWAAALTWFASDFLPRLRTKRGGDVLIRTRARAVARVAGA